MAMREKKIEDWYRCFWSRE